MSHETETSIGILIRNHLVTLDKLEKHMWGVTAANPLFYSGNTSIFGRSDVDDLWVYLQKSAHSDWSINPSEKYESIGMMTFPIYGNISQSSSSHHQPDNHHLPMARMAWFFLTSSSPPGTAPPATPGRVRRGTSPGLLLARG